ncbi:MAG: DUF2141 domain-containing protein [Anaerolineae bacterium]|nr:DUF2141 domain-containing protein [Phycisphaerae bacterium]
MPLRQNSSAEPTTNPALAKLTIKVVDLRSHKGQLIYGVFDSEKGFPSSSKLAKNWQVRAVDADTLEFTCELPPGKYGASALHDENNNNKMDTNLVGIPSEGYAVTNNPKPRFRAAKFSESIFELPPEGKTLTISMQYF